MKLVHYINFFLIFVFLIAICVIEENLVSTSLESVQNQCCKIENYLVEKDSLKQTELVLMVDNLEFTWTEQESKLCYLVNHASIKEIGYEVSHLKGYIENDDIDAFKVALQAIIFYSHSYLHFMGANFHNIL